jgi:hypothetical protein
MLFDVHFWETHSFFFLTFHTKVVASLYKKNIQRLTKTFLTLSLADVASRVQLSDPAEAEKYILNMVSQQYGKKIWNISYQVVANINFSEHKEFWQTPGGFLFQPRALSISD